MTNNNDGLSIARQYHDAWTSKDFTRAAHLLDRALQVEVRLLRAPIER